MPTNIKASQHNEEENPLISLLEKTKKAFEGVSLMRIIRRDFDLVRELREKGVAWREIVEVLNFPGMEARARYAFFYEKRRRAKKGKEGDAEKKTKSMPESKILNRRESPSFMSQEKERGGRTGPPRAIGGGRLDLGGNIPDEEL